MKTPGPFSTEIDDDRTRLNFDRVHQWLTRSYWSPGIPLETVKQGAEYSTVVLGCYGEVGQEGPKSPEGQVGYLRVISDRVRFAYVMDVFVAPERRRQGIAKALMEVAKAHPLLSGVYMWLLATKDMHPVYAQTGFGPLPEPERWMLLRKDPPWTELPPAHRLPGDSLNN
jgi:GNAT superfamily N-acetyltransferase